MAKITRVRTLQNATLQCYLWAYIAKSAKLSKIKIRTLHVLIKFIDIYIPKLQISNKELIKKHFQATKRDELFIYNQQIKSINDQQIFQHKTNKGPNYIPNPRLCENFPPKTIGR